MGVVALLRYVFATFRSRAGRVPVGRGEVVRFTGGLEFTARRWAQFGEEADELLRRMIDGR